MAIKKGYKDNFTTLQDAARNGDLALLECNDATSGKPVMAICAVNRCKGGDVQFVPLAKLFDGNPYEELIPPHSEAA